MGTSLTQHKHRIFQELGVAPEPVGGQQQPGVTVELSDEAFKTATALTMQWFTARKGYTIFRPMPVAVGVAEYQLADDVAQVLDVVFQVPSDVAAFFSLGFFDLIPYGPQNIGSLGSGLSQYSGFAQLLQFNEQRKRIFSVVPEWVYQQQTRKLFIPIRSGAVTNMVLLEIKLNTFDPASLVDKDDYIFGRYLFAKCKEIVGRIRSKYDSLPGASGPVILDGKELLAEAKEEIARLEIEIFASQGPDAAILG